MKQNITCLCGRSFSIDIEEEINLDKNADQLEKICNGTFMTFDCPECGKKHKPEYSVKLLWKSKNVNFEVLPELDRGEFYRRKKDSSSFETIIGYPEMADRIVVIRDELEPIVIEAIKSFLLAKAEETYPDKEINAWYIGKTPKGIEFHLDGIKQDEVAVMIVPYEIYEKTQSDYKKRPKNDIFTSLRHRTYLSVQNLYRHDALK
ncbi:MAG: CpXC domain-containing protein [Treponema sp.]|jgi:hypothetical protein|nr:CpXC domain-containing protein [Treponema sp.]